MTEEEKRKQTVERMAELMVPIDNAIMMSDNVLDVLMLEKKHASDRQRNLHSKHWWCWCQRTLSEHDG